jgi:hypothetical protein
VKIFVLASETPGHKDLESCSLPRMVAAGVAAPVDTGLSVVAPDKALLGGVGRWAVGSPMNTSEFDPWVVAQHRQNEEQDDL